MNEYLTKSKFTLCLDCPTKLYYATNEGYKSTLEDNDFLEALAKGGIQVGELAKLYYPGGTDIETLDKDESLRQTNELLKQDNAIIYEAAVMHEQCFIRVDILVKEGITLKLIEVKSKSWKPGESFYPKTKNTISPKWQKYLYDVAFQYRVMQKAFPDHHIEPCLMMIDKSVQASVDGLHQKFKVVEENGRYKVKIKPGVTTKDLGNQILTAVPVIDQVEQILAGYGREPQSKPEASGFDNWIETLTDLIQKNEKYPVEIGAKCKNCEFRVNRDELADNEKSGFEECWGEALGWKDEDFERPHIFDIWYGSTKKYTEDEIYFMDDLVPDNLPAHPDNLYTQSEWDRKNRQTVQIMKTTGNHSADLAVLDTLFEEMDSWTYPLHFIDFEAVMAAIPFHKGLYPYKLVPFQFSCHTIHEDGRLEHRYDWIEERPGVLPSIGFARELKKCLEGDEGTVFRYHNFENTVLKNIVELLENIQPEDADELIDFLRTLIRGGSREMVDQYKLTEKYYYSSHMGGSISIKNVLPAVLTESERLKDIYSKPYNGLYLKNKIFYREDPETGNAISPYKLLDPVGHGMPDYEEAERYIDEETISDGGVAMMAWSRIQFDDVPEHERQAVLKSLYEYCELDTLAMVMIHQHWEELKQE